MEVENPVKSSPFSSVGMNAHKICRKTEDSVSVISHKQEMFEGKNIHSSPVDGKLLCSFSQKMCMQRRLNGFAFCIRHILEDKHAPFKQCQFVTKYNGNQCINPVPVAEDRIYCNSHLQVLGLAPKKTKKKPIVFDCVSEETGGVNESGSASSGVKKKVKEILNKDHPKEVENKCLARKSSKIKVNPSLPSSNLTFSQWNPCFQIWKHFWRRQRSHNVRFKGNLVFDEIKELKKALTQDKLWEFRCYMFHQTGRETIYSPMPLCQASYQVNTTFGSGCKTNLCQMIREQERKILTQLRHHQAQLKLAVHEKLKSPGLSYSVLSAIISAARRNTAATSNVLAEGRFHRPFKIRKVSVDKVVCCHKVVGDKECGQTALPYCKFCTDHVGYEERQVLFGKCTAKFPSGTSCSVPVLDFVNERPLCQEHARKRAESIEKSTVKVSPKKSRKPPVEEEKEKEKNVKQTPPKKNLKAKLQKKFAIPVKPNKKFNIAAKGSQPLSLERVPNLPPAAKVTDFRQYNAVKKNEVRNKRRLKLKEIAEREARTKADLKSKDDDQFKLTNIKNNKGPPLSPLDIQEDSFSSPSISPTYEIDELGADLSQSSFLGMDCNHRDTFDPEDEDMSVQLSKNSYFTKPTTQISRQITSPTLNQLSIDDYGRKGSFGGSSSPRRLNFSSASPLSPPQSRRHTSPLKLDGNDMPFSTALSVGRRGSDGLDVDSQLSTPSSINSSVEDDRYVLDSIEPEGRLPSSRLGIISPPRDLTTTKMSSSKINLLTKFSLPGRNDLPACAGFIRMSPSSTPSMYSPPFGVTSSPRCKAQVFKFDASSMFHPTTEQNHCPKSINLSSSKESVFVPIQERMIGTEKRLENEPPMEKVNPDIFFSPAAFSSSPSSAS